MKLHHDGQDWSQYSSVNKQNHKAQTSKQGRPAVYLMTFAVAQII
jgi:hypothetical protein